MFSGPSAGGLQAGPTAGAITTNPAAYIPTDGLAIAQIDQLRGELAQKHPLLSAAAPLGQNLVASLSSDLAARATTTAVAAGLAQKQDVIAENSLPQSRVVGLVADWVLCVVSPGIWCVCTTGFLFSCCVFLNSTT